MPYLPCELQAEHDHASHPEKQDVVASLKESSREEAGEVGCLVGPAHD